MYLAKEIKYALRSEDINFNDENIKKAINLDNELDIKLQEQAREKPKDELEALIDIDTGELSE